MGYDTRLTRAIDENGDVVYAMCCLCFEFYEAVPAHAGGMWTVEDGTMVDVCVYCNADEYLVKAAAMNA